MWTSGFLLALVTTHAWALSGQLSQEPLQKVTTKLNLTHDLLAFHKGLVEIESITYNEQAVGEWLSDSLVSQGYSVERQYLSHSPDRFNVLAWPGSSKNATVLLSSHIDTVPPFYPYQHSKQTISGRGSVDAKGSVATQIIAVNNLISHHRISPDDVALLYVVGEEVGGDGMRTANALDLSPKTIIFGEPTEGKLAAGHKGNLAVSVRAIGKAAHSGYPWLGRSANEVLILALASLINLGDDLPQSDKYGKTTLNIGKMEGGVAGNVVAQDASATIAVRIAAGEPGVIETKIKQAIYHAIKPFLTDDLKAENVVEIRFPSTGYGPINIDHDVPGFKSITVNYGTDIPWFNQTVDDQKRYLYGPGSILVAHSDHEMLTEAQLWDAVDGYERIIMHALGKN